MFTPTSVVDFNTGATAGFEMSNALRLVLSTTYKKLPVMVNLAVEPPAPADWAAPFALSLVQLFIASTTDIMMIRFFFIIISSILRYQ